MTHQILIIEDHQEIARLLAMHLRDLNFEVSIVNDGHEGLKRAQQPDFDLIILDLMLPGIDGLEICKRLRQQACTTPILMLTSKSAEIDRVLGLELGADDYVTKPFSCLELTARVRAILRRTQNTAAAPAQPNTGAIHYGELFIDKNKRTVSLKKRMIELTNREFDLLCHFAKNPGRVYSRSQLLDAVWGYGHEGYEHTVNSHINRLRVKLELNPAQPHYILTVWGVGYKLAEINQTPATSQ